MNDSVIKKVSVSFLRAPLNQPFRTALGEHENLENILFVLELSDGTKGYGEAAIAPHITKETVHGTFKNLQSVTPYLTGRNVRDYLKISSFLHERFSNNRSAIAAVEMALLDALTRRQKIPLWKFFGKKTKKIRTDITIVIADPKETEKTAKKFYKQGFRAFKVKIGRDEDSDFKRVLAVHRLTRKSTIYLDANQGYTAEETLRFLTQLKKANVYPALIEQPVPKDDWEGLKRVNRLSGLVVCADETVSSVSDAVKLIRQKAASAINIKLMKSGLIEGRQIALLAKRSGIKLMMGGMMETSLAMTAAAHLASGLGFFDYIDLDTPFFIKKKFDKNPYLSSNGIYNLHDVKSGIGIVKEGGVK